MIIRAPAPVAPVAPTTDWTVTVTVDMAAHVINVIATVPGAAPRVDQQPIPLAIQTALENYAQQRAEVLLGLQPGTSTVPTP